MKKIIRILCIVIAIVCTGCASNTSKENILPIIVEDESFTGYEISMNVKYCDEELENVPNFVYQILDEEKENLKKFFKEEYRVNVKKALNKIDKIYAYDTKSDLITGFSDENKIIISRYILSDILNDDIMIRSIIRRELIHCLGVESTDNEYTLLVEGFAEELAIQASKYAGVEYVENEAYYIQIKVARQILIADKKIVKKFLSKEFKLENYINDTLKDASQKYNTSSNVARLLSNCINKYYYLSNRYEEVNILPLQIQYIVFAYCNTFELDEEEVKAIEANSIIDTSELNY